MQIGEISLKNFLLITLGLSYCTRENSNKKLSSYQSFNKFLGMNVNYIFFLNSCQQRTINTFTAKFNCQIQINICKQIAEIGQKITEHYTNFK